MTSEILLSIMIGLIVFNFLFSTILDFINDRNWNDSIPESVKDFYSKEAYIKAKNYAKEKGDNEGVLLADLLLRASVEQREGKRKLFINWT